MSIYATKWAYAQPVKPAGRKFVLVAIADFADAEGRAFPGVDTLANMTGQDERSVRRHVDGLEKSGYLKTAPRRRQDGSRTTDEMWLQAPPEALRPPPVATGQIARKPSGQNARLQDATGQSVTASGQFDQTNRTICPPLPGNLSGHEPSLNHHLEPSQENTLAADAAARIPSSNPELAPDPTGLHRQSGQAQAETDAEHISATSLEKVPPAAPRAQPTDFARIVAAWNDHRGTLPEVRDVTEGRKKAVRKLLTDCGGDVERAVQTLTDATREVALDPFWQGRRYGFDNLVPGKVTQKAEAWHARRAPVSTPRRDYGSAASAPSTPRRSYE